LPPFSINPGIYGGGEAGAMGYLAQFKIQFVGLSPGEHSFNYSIDSQFFSQFENSVIQQGDLVVDLKLKKQDNLMLLGFNIEGLLHVKCDRCAGDFDLPVKGFRELIMKPGDEEKELSENLVVISRNAHEINVAQYIYEFITLMVPSRIVHPDDAKGISGCDKKTLAVIKQLEGKTKKADERWEALKKLNIK